LDMIYSSIHKKVNNIISLINKNKYLLMNNSKLLVPIEKDNIQIYNTEYIYNYDKNVDINVINEILTDFEIAGIIDFKDNIELGKRYYFIKGMYQNNIEILEKNIVADNLYEYLSNKTINIKWNSINTNLKIMHVYNFNSKLIVKISGISNNIEFNNFNMYLGNLLNLYNINSKKQVTYKETKFKLKSLKNKDPLLYNFKQIYNSDIIYSKICQKPYQPLLLNPDEYEKLPDERKEKAIKYKNFTTNKPVYYSCPNSKFPYIKFIVNQHPKNYCIPCCKKTPMDDRINPKRRSTHNECLKNFKYVGDSDNVTKGSNYISSYGKSLEVGRLSRLPENTLEPLLFNKVYGNFNRVEESYYIYGVDQNTEMINDIGYLYCISHALNMSIEAFIKLLVVKINKNPNLFMILLNGTINKYFASVDDLIKSLLQIYNLSFSIEIPWNKLLQDLVFIYLEITTIYFKDVNNNVDIVLPNAIKNTNDIITPNRKYLVIIENNQNIYPIYLINIDVYKKTGIITGRLFEYDSGLIINIKNILDAYFKNNVTDDLYITLTDIIEFTTLVSSVTIKKLLINSYNLCYGVVLTKSSKDIYFPIIESYYNINYDISMMPYKTTSDVKATLSVIKMYNNWAKSYNKNTIQINNWLSYKSNIIGFNYNNLHYYFTEVPINKFNSMKIEVKELLYDPYIINSLIYKNQNNVTNYQSKKISNVLYNYYIYDLVLIQFITYINDIKNDKLRKKITNLFKSKKYNEIFSLVSDEDLDNIKLLLKRKSTFILRFNNFIFNFDNYINNIIDLQLTEIKKIFKDIGKKIFYITDKDVYMDDIIAKCGDYKYCVNGKLSVKESVLTNIIDNISNIIKNNPFNVKWLFNITNVEKNIDFFNFTKKENEYINIIYL